MEKFVICDVTNIIQCWNFQSNVHPGMLYTEGVPVSNLVRPDRKESIMHEESKDGKKPCLFNGELIRENWLNGRKDSS